MRREESRHVFQVRDTFPFVFFFFSLDGAWTCLTWPCPPPCCRVPLEFASFLANITGSAVIPKPDTFYWRMLEVSFTCDNMFPSQHVSLDNALPSGQDGSYHLSVVLVFLLRTSITTHKDNSLRIRRR